MTATTARRLVRRSPRRQTADVVFVYSTTPGGLTPSEAIKLMLALRACSDNFK